jgi:hypothetical protein
MTGDEEYLVQVSDSTVADDEKSAQVKCEDCDEKGGEIYCGMCRQILCEDCWARWAKHRRNDPSHPIVSYQEQ